MIQASFTDW